MSQSPANRHTSGSDRSQVNRYRTGWSQLNQLLRRGGSLSGREQNCCYLNLGASTQARFADVSHVAGFDSSADGRGLAIADWDRDGDLDCWLSNRTGPRVQFMRNNSNRGHRFVSLRLRGTSSNRDAIGARVEIEVEPPLGVLSRTVTAGDAYLSQSSKTLHFGLGNAKRITQVRVRWPGSAKFEAIDGVTLDGEFDFTEGMSNAVPRGAIASVSSVQISPKVANNTKINKTYVVGRIPLVPISAKINGVIQDLELVGQPTLLLLWAPHCPLCLEELASWSQYAENVRKSGLAVVGISAADVAAWNDAECLQRTRQAIEETAFPFECGLSDATQLQLIEAYLGFLQYDYQRPLQVPMSLLLDRHGQVAVVYRGPVSADTVLADLSIVDDPPVQLRSSSLPYPGKWIRPLGRPSPIDFASRISERFGDTVANAYLEHLVQLAARSRQAATRPGDDASHDDPYSISPIWEGHAFRSLGTMALAEGRFADAESYSKRAIELIPNDFRSYSNRGAALAKMGRLQDALVALNRALELRPDRPSVLVNRAFVYSQIGRPADAIGDWETLLRTDPDDAQSRLNAAALAFAVGDDQRAAAHYTEHLRREPGSPDTAGALAWILATSSDAAVRDGKRAVTLATTWWNHSKGRSYKALNALAAAFAECGEFEQAIAAIDRAIKLAGQSGDRRAISAYQQRRATYQKHKPFHRKKTQR